MMTLAIIRRAMLRALQWRLLLLSPIVLLVAAAATLLPLARFLGELFDHSPRWNEIATTLDSAALASVIKALGTPAAAGLATGVQTSLLLAVVFAPFLAGAALVVAGTGARQAFGDLLSGAARHYPRLLRMQVAALLPLGAAAAVAAVVFTWASRVSDRVTSDAATHTSSRIAWLISVIAVLVAQLVVDAGRARLAAEPARRSALVALGAGVKLIVKRPLQALSLGFSASFGGLAVAAVLLIVRQQITQSGVVTMLVAFLLAQLAVASIAWAHATKLCGLVEIARDLGASPASEPRAATATPAEPDAVSPTDVLAPEIPDRHIDASGASGASGRAPSAAPEASL
jgi:hypothetical protein